MTTHDILQSYIAELHKTRAAEINHKLAQFQKEHPNASNKDVEALQDSLWQQAQNANFIEIKVLEAGKFWPKQEKEPFIIDLLKAPIPLWCVIFIFMLVLIALI